jgi:hypothetical protein
MEQIKIDEVKNKHKIKGDLNYLKEFRREQKRLLEIERQEEETDFK